MGDIERQPEAPTSNAPSLVVRVARSIDDVESDDWNACASGGNERNATSGHPPNPFVSHAFFKALEDSNSASPETGWHPQHLLYEDSDGRLLACMPCYLKTHSQGEYVFDHGWAEAYMQAGGLYYPKLQVGVPFSPVPGPRLLARSGPSPLNRQAVLLQAGRSFTHELGVSSLHITFMDQTEWQLAGELGFLQRTDQQFHWRNDGYGTFDDFLATLSSRKRKAIRRERRDALADGLDIEWVSGRALTEDHWDTFFSFYSDTGSRKWGAPYLTRQFFSLLGESMADEISLVLAKRGGDIIAGALNVIGADTLYGRYWGALEKHDFLHFEVCYYQAIEYAIQNRLETVEAGAQGAHKLARGYLPTETYSAHYIADPGLRRAVADYLRRERHAVTQEAALLATCSPYRRDPD